MGSRSDVNAALPQASKVDGIAVLRTWSMRDSALLAVV